MGEGATNAFKKPGSSSRIVSKMQIRHIFEEGVSLEILYFKH
jgi:hypothetical protein